MLVNKIAFPIIRNMSSVPQRDPIQWTDIVSAHASIGRMKSSAIKNLFHRLDGQMQRQLLLVYTRFLLDMDHQSQHLNPKNPCSSIHQSIIHLIRTVAEPPKHRLFHCIFDKLPTMLISQCISFLTQTDRVSVSKTNLLLMRAANTSIAKYHLRINRSLIEREDQLRPPFHSVGAIDLRNIGGELLRRLKSSDHFKNLLIQNSIQKLSGRVPVALKPLFKTHIQQIARVQASCRLPHLVASAKYITNLYPTRHRFMWLKDINTPKNVVNIWNVNALINKCCFVESHAEHLEFEIVYGIDHFHPIYWLWNLKHLKSCSMSLQLPSSVTCEYMKQFEDLLASETVLKCARQQTTFKELNLVLFVAPRKSDTERIERWRAFPDVYRVFLQHLNRLYPHLSALTLKIGDGYKSLVTLNSLADLIRIGTSLPFQNLQRIHLNIISVSNAIDVLSDLNRYPLLKSVTISF